MLLPTIPDVGSQRESTSIHSGHPERDHFAHSLRNPRALATPDSTLCDKAGSVGLSDATGLTSGLPDDPYLGCQAGEPIPFLLRRVLVCELMSCFPLALRSLSL